jgi:hypothetical protein
MIRGASVMTSVPVAGGRDFGCDETTLDQVVALGNAAPLGIKVRFGHPNMSGDAIGTYLGRARNFRRDGERARADITMAASAEKSPRGNLSDYVLTLAEEDPAAFGCSVVMSGEVVDVPMGASPAQVMPPGMMPPTEDDEDEDEAPRKVFRCTALLGCDVVDEPAANPAGMLSSDQSFAARATGLLEEFSRAGGTAEQLRGFVQRAATNGSRIAADFLSTSEGNMSDEPKTEELTAVSTERLAKLEAELAAANAEREELRRKAAETERLSRLDGARREFAEAVRLGKLPPALKTWALGHYDASNAPIVDENGAPKGLGYAVTDPAGFAAFLSALAPGAFGLMPVQGATGTKPSGDQAALDYLGLINRKATELMAAGWDERTAKFEAARVTQKDNPDAYRAYYGSRPGAGKGN